MSNYRPVSNLSFMSKVVERVVAEQLNEYLLTDDLMPRYQLRVWSDMLNAADTRQVTLLGLLDLSAVLTASITTFYCSGWSTASGWLTLYCGGSIHSCLIVHSKLPTEANCLQHDHSCSAFHKAPFWGHCCTFCTLPNSNMWSHSMACVYTSMLMTANFTFM